MIKAVPIPNWDCENCVFNMQFECIQMTCSADPNSPIKCIEVTE